MPTAAEVRNQYTQNSFFKSLKYKNMEYFYFPRETNFFKKDGTAIRLTSDHELEELEMPVNSGILQMTSIPACCGARLVYTRTTPIVSPYQLRNREPQQTLSDYVKRAYDVAELPFFLTEEVEGSTKLNEGLWLYGKYVSEIPASWQACITVKQPNSLGFRVSVRKEFNDNILLAGLERTNIPPAENFFAPKNFLIINRNQALDGYYDVAERLGFRPYFWFWNPNHDHYILTMVRGEGWGDLA